MSAGFPSLHGRLEEVRERIARAAPRAGREVSDIVLVAVVKTVPAELVREAVGAGLRDLGENRVQEAEAKIPLVEGSGLRWHLVGHLQRNKAARAVALFERIHSVDDIGVARAISRGAVEQGREVRALIQVNVSQEPTKHGVAPADVVGLLEGIAGLPGLVVDGLMSIGTPVAVAEDARPEFVRLRELRDRTEPAAGIRLPVLSMGMSADYEVAIEEGSTMVRVGTAIFGPREP